MSALSNEETLRRLREWQGGEIDVITPDVPCGFSLESRKVEPLRCAGCGHILEGREAFLQVTLFCANCDAPQPPIPAKVLER